VRARQAALVSPRRALSVGNPQRQKETPVRGILLWILGIPIPIIILLYLFNVL
jgi:hypothetical protein